MSILKKTARLSAVVVVALVIGVIGYKTITAHLTAKQINFMNSRYYPTPYK
jgi:hypothetical protein